MGDRMNGWEERLRASMERTLKVPVFTGTPIEGLTDDEAEKQDWGRSHHRTIRGGSVITTEEELDALPVGTVILSQEVTHHEGGWQLSYQRWQDGDWHRGARSGSTHPANFLPATVLHVGGAK